MGVVELLLLIGIAFVAGIVTAISPCVLPVLPIIFAGSVTGSRFRPFAVIGGLIVSFTAFTLAATVLLSSLGLPNDLLRNIAIGVVFVLAAILLFPRIGDLAGRPFHRLARRNTADVSGGFVLGLSLGLLFTPCAGPIIASIAVVAATRDFSADAVVVTLAYAFGAGVILLGIALAAQRGLNIAPLKARASYVRRGLGAVVAAAGVIMVLGLDTRLASQVPGYTRALQGLEESSAAEDRIDSLFSNNEESVASAAIESEESETNAAADGAESETNAATELAAYEDYGPAPDFRDISLWLNSEELTLADLRGKVVLIDFWTYSCINCLRTLPHIKRWDETYRDEGLVIVGVHSPEFAFEREAENVRDAVDDLGVEYAVALDNDFSTWQAWGNRYWPSKYFIDKQGHVRHFHFGEGAYDESEDVIRALLAEGGEELPGVIESEVEVLSPTRGQTTELYLGFARMANFVGGTIKPDETAEYEAADDLPLHGFTLGGTWLIEDERAVAGPDARLRLRYVGQAVHLVLGTEDESKTVDVSLDGEPRGSITVTEDKLYTLGRTGEVDQDHLLELRFEPGTEAYAFTFGELPTPGLEPALAG